MRNTARIWKGANSKIKSNFFSESVAAECAGHRTTISRFLDFEIRKVVCWQQSTAISAEFNWSAICKLAIPWEFNGYQNLLPQQSTCRSNCQLNVWPGSPQCCLAECCLPMDRTSILGAFHIPAEHSPDSNDIAVRTEIY